METSWVLQWGGEFLECSFDHSHSYLWFWILSILWCPSWHLFRVIPKGESFQPRQSQSCSQWLGRGTVVEWVPWIPPRGLPVLAAASSWAGQAAPWGMCAKIPSGSHRDGQTWAHSHPSSGCSTLSLPLAGAGTHFPHSWPWWAPLPAGTVGAATPTHPQDTKHPP